MKGNEKMVIIIDEFPNLVEKGVVTEFQKAWDLYLSRCNTFLILVGSSISMMERLTLDYSSPLYGRRTMQMRVDKLSFTEAHKFMPHKTWREFLKIFAVTEGIPYYILQMDPALTPEENIKRNVLSKDRVLYAEAEFLLRMELREFRNYFPVLEAISSGKRKFWEIAGFAEMDAPTLSKYLKNLKDIGIICEDLPVLGGKKNRRHKLSDNYFTFWFGFVHPNRTLIELGEIQEAWRNIREGFHIYLGKVFEYVIIQVLRRELPEFNVGKWWNRQGEIYADFSQG